LAPGTPALAPAVAVAVVAVVVASAIPRRSLTPRSSSSSSALVDARRAIVARATRGAARTHAPRRGARDARRRRARRAKRFESRRDGIARATTARADARARRATRDGRRARVETGRRAREGDGDGERDEDGWIGDFERRTGAAGTDGDDVGRDKLRDVQRERERGEPVRVR
jgi:hypothetical protein